MSDDLGLHPLTRQAMERLQSDPPDKQERWRNPKTGELTTVNHDAYGWRRESDPPAEQKRCPTCGETGPDTFDPVGDYGGEPLEARCGDEWHAEQEGERPDWKRLDELLRDPDIGGKRFLSEAEVDRLLAASEARADKEMIRADIAEGQTDQLDTMLISMKDQRDHALARVRELGVQVQELFEGQCLDEFAHERDDAVRRRDAALAALQELQGRIKHLIDDYQGIDSADDWWIDQLFALLPKEGE